MAIADLNADSAAAVAKELEGLGRQSMAVQVDVSNEEQVKAMVAKVVEAWGTVDILINSAGINRRNKLIDLAVEDYDAIMDVNLRGTFPCCQGGREDHGRQRFGIDHQRLLHVRFHHQQGPARGRLLRFEGGGESPHQRLCRRMGQERRPGQRHRPRLFQNAPQLPLMATEQGPEALSLTPMGRFAEPEEIGPLAVFLASPASSFITGHVVLIDGGYTIW